MGPIIKNVYFRIGQLRESQKSVSDLPLPSRIFLHPRGHPGALPLYTTPISFYWASPTPTPYSFINFSSSHYLNTRSLSMNCHSFSKTLKINLPELNLQPLKQSTRNKSTEHLSSHYAPYTDRDYHKKLYLRNFDYGKLQGPSWFNQPQKQYRPSTCTTARQSNAPFSAREEASIIDELFEDENWHPNIPRMSSNPRKVESTIKTTIKDRTVITDIIKKYQNTRTKPLRS